MNQIFEALAHPTRRAILELLKDGSKTAGELAESFEVSKPTMLAAALAVGSSAPADMQLPVHWGLNGEPDRFAGKWEALLTIPALTAAVSLLFYFIPAIEPRREGLARSQGLYLWGWVAILLMGSVIQLATVSLALG